MHRRFLWLSLLLGSAALSGVCGELGITPMHFKLERESVNMAEPRFRAYITSENNQFGFSLPAGYRLTGDPASGTVTLANRAGNGSVTFKILGPMPESGTLDTEVYRGVVSNQFYTATILTNFWRNNGVGGGPGFDLQWRISDNLFRCQRVVFLGSPAGVLEFTAVADRLNFPACRDDLDTILMSFHCTTDGTKPQVPRLAPES